MVHALSERDQIIEVINKMFVYTDTYKWSQLKEEVFTEIVEVDMTSMGAQAPMRISARDICKEWEQNFKDLDAVHHQAGNYLVRINDLEADVQAYSIASHYLKATKKGNTRTYVGSYDLHLTKTSRGWRVDKFKYILKYSTGNLTLE